MDSTCTDSPGSIPVPVPVAAVSLVRRARAVMAAEWIKVRSLRSLSATLATAAVFCIGLAVVVCSNYSTRWTQFSVQKQAAFDPADVNLGFLEIGVLFFGALGALAVTNEYGSGLIHTTFAATPQRGVVLGAKAAWCTIITLAGSAVICLTAFLAGQSLLTEPAPHTSLRDPAAVHALLGAILYLTLAGLFGLFLGVLLRSTAAAVSALFGIFLVLPVLVDDLPHSLAWRRTVPYLPSNLGEALWHSHSNSPDAALTTPATAAVLLTGYVLALAAAGSFVLRHRDA